jgi:hypothetical protein
VISCSTGYIGEINKVESYAPVTGEEKFNFILRITTVTLIREKRKVNEAWEGTKIGLIFMLT